MNLAAMLVDDAVARALGPRAPRVERRRQRDTARRDAIMARDGGACCWCACVGVVMTVEHLKPRGMGGTSEVANLAFACNRCNNLRGCRLEPPPGIKGSGWASVAWYEGRASWVDLAALREWRWTKEP